MDKTLRNGIFQKVNLCFSNRPNPRPTIKYFILNKPYGVLSQFTEEQPGQRTLAEFFPDEKNIYPVGRLDSDSEGLLVLTDDKRLNFELLDPRFKHKRTYFGQVEGAPTEADLAIFKTGISLKIDGKPFKCAPAEAHILEKTPDFPERNPPVRFRANIPTTWISVQLTEGKNRQVRRMCAAAGFPVLRLVRVAIEDLDLGGLQPGERQSFSETEIRGLLRLKRVVLKR